MAAFLQRLKAWPWGRIIIIALLCVAAIVGAIWLKKIVWPVKPVNTTPQVMQEAPQAEDIPRLEIPPPKKLVVYSRDELLRKIPQPAAVAQNPHNQFTATAAITPSPYGGTAVAYTNRSTGVSGITYTPKPRPWIEWGGSGAIGIRGGVGATGDGTGYTGTLFVRQKLITVVGKPLTATGELNLSTYRDTEIKGMLETDIFSWN